MKHRDYVQYSHICLRLQDQVDINRTATLSFRGHSRYPDVLYLSARISSVCRKPTSSFLRGSQAACRLSTASRCGGASCEMVHASPWPLIGNIPTSGLCTRSHSEDR